MEIRKQNFLNKLIANPKRIFLFDALGALLTTILLFGVLAQLRKYFGMPSNVLYVLSGIGFCLFLYSLSCHLFIKSNWRPFIGVIIVCNIIYLMFSIEMIYKYYDKLTELELIYFILELTVIGIIVIVEYNSFKSYRRIKK